MASAKMKQQSKVKKDPDQENELRTVLKRLLSGGTGKSEDKTNYGDILERYKLKGVVCALFTLKIPPFNKAIENEMARECANFLFELRRSSSGDFRLASNNELAAAASTTPPTFSNWRLGKSEKSKAAVGFCAFLQSCKAAMIKEELPDAVFDFNLANASDPRQASTNYKPPQHKVWATLHIERYFIEMRL